ncbi:MAG: cadmium-translocating P-type ATPase [Helicobacteraceae bacterium]|nr:cadmium-translocating P-type ATPase [Helicobacteraceae bacterium]
MRGNFVSTGKGGALKCAHCGLECREVIAEGDLSFCCEGCRGVYHLLRDMKLERFYALKGGSTLSAPKQPSSDSGRFDSEAFKRRYVKDKDSFKEVSLIFEGIHCTACIWLNEKVLERTDGIRKTQINFTTHKAKILFDPEKITPGRIVDTIRSIGYDAAPYDPQLAEARADRERRDYYTRLVVAIFAVMNVMWLAVARYLGLFSGMDIALAKVIYLVEFCLATPTLFYSGWIFFRGGYYALKNGFVTMDLLVATGATLTYLYSIYAVLIAGNEPYFDSVAMIIAFVLIGKFLEVKAKKNAVDALDLLLAESPSEVVRLQGGRRERVAPEVVVAGDLIEAAAGERIVFDGVVVSGEALLDMASLSGESELVAVKPGSAVLGGAINANGVLLIEAQKDYEHSTFRTIVALLEESLENRPSIENLANRLSRRFSSTVLMIAVLTFFAWLVGSPFNQALMVAVSVIVIACPCALALATPIASVIGAGESAKRHILFRAARHLETMAKAKRLLLDKTGTLTEGRPAVVSSQYPDGFDGGRLLGLIESSTHPVAAGVREFLLSRGFTAVPARGIKNIAARGVEADGLLGGNAKFMRENGIEVEEEGVTHFFFADGGTIRAKFCLADRLRPNAKEAMERLRRMGLSVTLLTGDTEREAERVSAELGITDAYSELLPQEKAALVERYRNEGTVVMVGDGLNDSIALAKSDIAIAMHSGTDTTIAVSDVILLRSSLFDLVSAFAISRKTYRTIKQNIAFSFIYNALSIPLAACGFVVPLIAALSMSLSSLIVVGNSFRIKGHETE